MSERGNEAMVGRRSLVTAYRGVRDRTAGARWSGEDEERSFEAVRFWQYGSQGRNLLELCCYGWAKGVGFRWRSSPVNVPRMKEGGKHDERSGGASSSGHGWSTIRSSVGCCSQQQRAKGKGQRAKAVRRMCWMCLDVSTQMG